MEDLIILGAGVHEAEMAAMVDRVNAVKSTWRLLGCVSAKDEPTSDDNYGLKVLGGPDVLAKYGDAVCIAGNAWNVSLPVERDRLRNLIDPTATIIPSAKLGVGCVFYPNCFVGAAAEVGDFTFALSGAIINHDDHIGRRVIFASGATLAGYVTVGDSAYLGQSCSVRQSLTIGERCLIGMGAVVITDTPARTVWIGNPAKQLRENG